ncbi:MAG: hypothetical protein H7Z14_18540, partial [Anaerolineae bacterium]|nr:hypothetical protein [Phycisphaerae bacterium]
MHARIALILSILICGISRAQPADVSRVLRTFDFEERRLGNVEELPMNWTKVEGAGLPHYVNGSLASDRVHGGKYSFRLELNGGSLIYRYQSGQIKVQRDAHYRVEGFVQTTPMPHARARMSVYFTDLDGHTIESTVRHSPLYSATAEVNTWQKIDVELTADAEKIAYLVVELGVLQPSAHSPAVLGERTLFPQDIHGIAWFDDLTVSQVPQVAMTSERPGNIFRRNDTRRLSVLVNDRFTDDLSAQLIVRDATGKAVYQKSGALDMKTAEILGPGRKRMTLTLPSELTTGWYEAALEMSSQGKFVGKQTLDLVLLADDAKPVAPDSRFGLIATDLPFEGWSELPQILPQLSAGRVKLAVWNDQGDIQQTDPAAFDKLLEELQELGITPTACLLSLPPSVQKKVRAKRSLAEVSSLDTKSILATPENSWLQILKAPLDTWQPQLAYLVARHANHLDRWQLGEDGSDQFVSQPKMREVYKLVYDQFTNLVQKPDLAMPWPAWYELDGEAPATVALHVKPDVLPSQLPLYMQDIIRSPGAGSAAKHEEHNLSVYLEPLDRAQYGREMQIQDLAQRIAYALSADARRIDIKLPFT